MLLALSDGRYASSLLPLLNPSWFLPCCIYGLRTLARSSPMLFYRSVGASTSVVGNVRTILNLSIGLTSHSTKSSASAYAPLVFSLSNVGFFLTESPSSASSSWVMLLWFLLMTCPLMFLLEVMSVSSLTMFFLLFNNCYY